MSVLDSWIYARLLVFYLWSIKQSVWVLMVFFFFNERVSLFLPFTGSPLLIIFCDFKKKANLIEEYLLKMKRFVVALSIQSDLCCCLSTLPFFLSTGQTPHPDLYILPEVRFWLCHLQVMTFGHQCLHL